MHPPSPLEPVTRHPPVAGGRPHAPQAGPFEPPLPALVRGDGPVARRPRHGWRGKLFIAISYAFSLWLGYVSVFMSLGGALDVSEPGALGTAVGAGVWSWLQWRLAREVRRFTRWGWYGAMAELGAATAAKLWLMAQGQPGAGVVGLAFDALLLHYFWKRRAQFDIDGSL